MDITAKTQDPASLRLRQRKKNWNKAVKEVINRMIEMKRALNGTGSEQYNLPASRIHNPIPSEVVSFLAELSSNFQQIASEASNIIQEQNQYSQNRRQPQTPKAASKIATASKIEFGKGKVLIGKNIFETDLAITPLQQEIGLMYETEPKIMSFPYSYAANNKFWMKNTPNRLSIILGCDGKVVEIAEGEPYSTRLIGSSCSDLVVEMPPSLAQQHNIKIGDPISLI